MKEKNHRRGRKIIFISMLVSNKRIILEKSFGRGDISKKKKKKERYPTMP